MKNLDALEPLEELGIITWSPCSQHENTEYRAMPDSELPHDVYPLPKYDYGSAFYRHSPMPSNVESIVAAKNALYTKTIRNCVIFITVLIVLSTLGSILAVFLP